MTGVSVREATTEDVAGIRRIAHEGWRAAYSDFLAEGVLEAVCEEWHTVEGFRESVSREEVTFFVAVPAGTDGNADDEHGTVIGYASGGIRDETNVGFVATLYVDPKRWGEGIGTRLFKRLLTTLNDRGAERVEIHVLAGNEIGITFYESQGFERIRESDAELPGARAPYREYVYASDL